MAMMRCFRLDGSAVEELPQVPPRMPAEGWLWIDCDYGAAREWVVPVSALTGITVIEDHLLSAGNLQHPSYFNATRDYEMIVFRGLGAIDEPVGDGRLLRIATRPTVFFVFPGCLVTVRAPDSRTVPALQQRLLEGLAGRHRQRPPESPEALMLRLLGGMVDRYLELRQPLTAQLERWQRLLLDPRRPFDDWYALLEARDELRSLEQLSEEQLDAIQAWRDERIEQLRAVGTSGLPHPPGFAGIADPLRVRAADLAEHVQRVLNHVRRLEASLESAVQMHFSAMAHRTNEVMRTLTTLSAIFMPLTLITGIFGMNFATIPGSTAVHGFWWVLAAMGIVALALLAWFRARRYLSAPERQLRRRRRVSASASRNEPSA
jgi:magnesium transporter